MPGATTAGGIAQLAAHAAVVTWRSFRRECTAPNIVDYNAANVPVAQLNVSSDTLSEQALFDYGLNFIRVACTASRAFRCRRRSADAIAR